MELQEAKTEYVRAMRMGQKQAKELTAKGLDPNPAVLDEILDDQHYESVQEVGTMDIPADRIVGVKSAGRIAAFSAGFYPVLAPSSEFASKWTNLCIAHMSDSGIREPILCYEYLGNFYVQEGNKRVSVLKYFGAPKIPGTVRRILPPRDEDDPRITAYYEFLEFYKTARIYDVQFCKPGQYAELLSHLGKEPGEEWTQWEQRTFSAYFQYFRDAYRALKGDSLDLLPEEALLLWLQIHPFQDLGELSGTELRQSLAQLWPDVKTLAEQVPMEVRTEPVEENSSGILSRIIGSTPDHLMVAFVHQRNPQNSEWIKAHAEGSQHLSTVLPGKVDVLNYYNADTPEEAEELLDQAAFEGADVVFTTTPQLSRATLKAAVKHPKVHFLNCSPDAPFASTAGYYCRVYEGKFITGAIAGAMTPDGRIGYIGSYPIFGVPASINAFALGAQLTNPRAKVVLRWSCKEGNPVHEFVKDGIRVISNRDAPTPSRKYLQFGEYGTYYVEDDYSLKPIGSPCWLWGKFYEKVARALLSGDWEHKKEANVPINYWWGMDSGVIDVKLSPELPDGLKFLAELLRTGLQNGTLDPFYRRITAQDGTVKNDGSRHFTPDEILHMDWLCSNVEGEIPPFEEIAPYAQTMVRDLGIYRDQIPKEKEGTI